MSKKRGFWVWLQIGAILLYGMILAGSYYIGQGRGGCILIGLMAILHLSEMRTALRIGEEKGLSLARILGMSLLFGFTWWVPLRMGVIER
jgi:hypothetical protein